MLKLLIRYATQFLLVVAVPITSTPLLSLLGLLETTDAGLATLLLGRWKVMEGPSDVVTLKVRLAISIIALIVLFFYEAVEVYVPRERARSFRTDWLDDCWKAEWSKRFDPDIRINVMRAKALLPLGSWSHRFVWIWNSQDKRAPKNDTGLVLFAFQGVCGLAYRVKKPIFVDFREPPFAEKWNFFSKNYFCLLPWQEKKTRDLTAVLSVPIRLRKTNSEGNISWPCVGVINLDAFSDTGADYLGRNRKVLAEEMRDFGLLLAQLLRV